MWPFQSDKSSKEASSSSTPVAGAVAEPGAAAGGGCPVDHGTRQRWLDSQQGQSSESSKPPAAIASSSKTSLARHPSLSTERELSSIPRHTMQPSVPSTSKGGDSEPSGNTSSSSSPLADASGNWIYPSPAQFHSALVRKGHSPEASDMNTVVPIHNAVNERCWKEILEWESLRLGSSSSTTTTSASSNANDDLTLSTQTSAPIPKLLSFQGKPTQTTIKAFFRGLLGYQRPFDRHDWIVVTSTPAPTPAPSSASTSPSSITTTTTKTTTRMRYIIDFYAGKPSTASASGQSNPFYSVREDSQGRLQPKINFYLDVRPAPDTFEGVWLRVRRALGETFGFGAGAMQRQQQQQATSGHQSSSN